MLEINRTEYDRMLSEFLSQNEPVTWPLFGWYYIQRHRFHEKMKRDCALIDEIDF